MAHKRTRPVAQMRAKTAARKLKPSLTAKRLREKVRAYRERMRAKGMRLVQIWVPDTRTPAFAAEAHRQSLLANTSPFAADDQAWVDSMFDWNSN